MIDNRHDYKRLEDEIAEKRSKGVRPTLKDVGINGKPLPPYAEVLRKMATELPLMINEVIQLYMIKYYPELKGKTAVQASDWIERNKVLVGALGQQRTLSGSTITYALASKKPPVFVMFEVTTRVSSDEIDSGKVKVEISHREIIPPQQLVAGLRETAGEYLP